MISNAPAKLIRLLEYHERAAAAIRLAIELLDDAGRESSTSRASQTINTAIGLDAMRHAATSTNGNGARRGRPAGMITRAMVDKAIARKPRPTGKQTKSKIRDQRERTAKYLKQFDRETPRAASFFRGLGPLVRRGYLTKKGDGYVLTAKQYEV